MLPPTVKPLRVWWFASESAGHPSYRGLSSIQTCEVCGHQNSSFPMISLIPHQSPPHPSTAVHGSPPHLPTPPRRDLRPASVASLHRCSRHSPACQARPDSNPPPQANAAPARAEARRVGGGRPREVRAAAGRRQERPERALQGGPHTACRHGGGGSGPLGLGPRADSRGWVTEPVKWPARSHATHAHAGPLWPREPGTLIKKHIRGRWGAVLPTRSHCIAYLSGRFALLDTY
mmetsp:Transcript_57473/g.182001  ORF Transcript_57473/g.182001 Transcript_57473/m.182001 type:complete len:233 (+) Transcript_57473:801-1499(+)